MSALSKEMSTPQNVSPLESIESCSKSMERSPNSVANTPGGDHAGMNVSMMQRVLDARDMARQRLISVWHGTTEFFVGTPHKRDTVRESAVLA